ncbi:hypothetical protein D3C71_1308850 [compost metagenome]
MGIRCGRAAHPPGLAGLPGRHHRSGGARAPGIDRQCTRRQPLRPGLCAHRALRQGQRHRRRPRRAGAELARARGQLPAAVLGACRQRGGHGRRHSGQPHPAVGHGFRCRAQGCEHGRPLPADRTGAAQYATVRNPRPPHGQPRTRESRLEIRGLPRQGRSQRSARQPDLHLGQAPTAPGRQYALRAAAPGGSGAGAGHLGSQGRACQGHGRQDLAR